MIRLRLLGPLHLVAADGTEVRAVLTQPKRLALLAYLAVGTPGGFHRRESLIALFWPESSEAQARLALRQSLHYLRSTLGPEVIARRGSGELALATEALWCDVVAFRDALDAGQAQAALDLYHGDLLEGFSFSGISLELERWLDDERAALRMRAARAAASLSRQATDAGDLASAVEWTRRELALSADDESVLRHLVRLLDRLGNRAAALRAVQDFTHRTLRELAAEPAAETKALADAIRSRADAHPVPEAAVLEPVVWAQPEVDQGTPHRAAVARTYGPISHHDVGDGNGRPHRDADAHSKDRRRVSALVASLLIAGGLGALVTRLRDI